MCHKRTLSQTAPPALPGASLQRTCPRQQPVCAGLWICQPPTRLSFPETHHGAQRGEGQLTSSGSALRGLYDINPLQTLPGKHHHHRHHHHHLHHHQYQQHLFSTCMCQAFPKDFIFLIHLICETSMIILNLQDRN